MADFLSSNTRRLRVLYTGPRGSHVMLFRNSGDASTMAALITAARAAATAFIGLQWTTTSWISAEGAEQDSDIFLPVVWGAAITAGGAANPTNADPFGFYGQFVGRSTAGSRVSWYLYNVNTSISSANNRFTPAESAVVSTITAALVANTLCAIDRNPFVMKQYANTGYNDHLVRVSRRAA
jgi:hypothetical protein